MAPDDLSRRLERRSDRGVPTRKLAAHRRFYNDAVTVLADQTGTFPGIVLRGPVLRGRQPALLDFDLPDQPTPVESS